MTQFVSVRLEYEGGVESNEILINHALAARGSKLRTDSQSKETLS